MKTRALTEISARQNDLSGYLLSVSTKIPDKEVDALDRKLSKAVGELEYKIRATLRELVDLQRDIKSTPEGTPLAADLNTRLDNVRQECIDIYNGDEVKAFNAAVLEIQKAQIDLHHETITAAINLINSFEIDYQKLPDVITVNSTLVPIQMRLEELQGDPSTITEAEINLITDELTRLNLAVALPRFQTENARGQASHKKFAVDVDKAILGLLVSVTATSQLTDLTALMAKIKLSHPAMHADLETTHTELTKRIEAVQTARAQLAELKDTLLSDPKTSKAAALKALDDGALDKAKATVNNVYALELGVKVILENAERELAVEASKPEIDKATTEVNRLAHVLTTLNTHPNITSAVFKTLVDTHIENNLDQYIKDLNNPKKIDAYKGKRKEQLLAESPAFQNGMKLAYIARAKIEAETHVGDLRTKHDSLTANPLLVHTLLTDNINMVLTELERINDKLDDPNISNIDATKLNEIRENLEHYKKGIAFYDESLRAYKYTVEDHKDVTTTLKDLKAAFTDRANAPDNVFTDLENEQKRLKAISTAIETHQRTLLSYPDLDVADAKAKLKEATTAAKDDTVNDARVELIEKANTAITAQKVKVAKDAAATAAKAAKDKLTADIKLVVDPLETAIKEAEAAIKEIVQLDPADDTVENEKNEHEENLRLLKRALAHYKKEMVNNPTAELKAEAEGALNDAKALKTAAEKSKKEEDDRNPTGLIKLKIDKNKKDAADRIKKVRENLDDLKKIKLKGFDKDAREQIKKVEKFIAEKEKELKTLEEAAKEDPAAVIDPAAKPADKVDQKVLDAITKQEDVIKKIDKLKDDTDHAPDIGDKWQADIDARIATASAPHTTTKEKAAFEILDKGMTQNVAAINQWERTIFAATASAEAKRHLTDEARLDIEEKSREMQRALLFYKEYQRKHPDAGRVNPAYDIDNQIDKLKKIEAYLLELNTDQQFVLQGEGVVGAKYYPTLEDAEKDLGTALYKPVAAGAISTETGRINIEPGKDAIRREHKMVVTKSDGTKETLEDNSITYTNPTTHSRQTNYYEKNPTAVDDVPDVETRTGPFKKISRPADVYLEEAMSRINNHSADKGSKSGAIFIHPGMPPKKCKAMIIALKVLGRKIDPNCYSLIDPNPNDVSADEVKLSAKALEKRGYLTPQAAAQTDARHEDTMSRFRKT